MPKVDYCCPTLRGGLEDISEENPFIRQGFRWCIWSFTLCRKRSAMGKNIYGHRLGPTTWLTGQKPRKKKAERLRKMMFREEACE